ncbi:site-specific integrase [Tropicibacter oceani]|uniref:Site-specific integrase n=1 Tax=Tropicibacter oceani TaxID=3058420 RepID=A0ABY8QD97_9RHOB|nr:site-specific integrase [Tropicibacter oceani]WGW02413.1 site-specific integrase [Tropicibacter oceani]
MQRKKKDGSHSYTAVIRKKKAGKVILTKTETFQNEQAAKRWLKKTERDPKAKGAVERAVAARQRKTWSDVIQAYCDASPEGFGKTKTATLAYLQRLDVGGMAVEETDDHAFFCLARDLLNGVQAPPADPDADCPEHYELKPRKPQTVNSYLATLRTVFLYGGPICKLDLPISAFETAMRTLKHQNLIGRSAKRDRRPTLEELDRLMSHFYDSFLADRRRVPMHKVIGAAITLGHRQEALCSIPWSDVDENMARLTIRNMKHPRQTAGNDVVVWITDEGMKLIKSMPRNNERVFAYNPDTVSRRFTDACKLLGIKDLRFHDLRHEAISRFFETGLDGGSRDIILKYTGHAPDGSLSRYIHVNQVSDKFAGWKWWDILFAPL